MDCFGVVVFLHFLVEYTLLMNNQLDATLGMLNSFYYAIFKIAANAHWNVRKFVSLFLGYIET